WVDGTCCFALYSKLNVDKVLMHPSPLGLAKALKNPVEIEGLKNAHIRDGAAVVQYLIWLDKQMQEFYGASGYFIEGESFKKNDQPKSVKLTEVSVSDKLEEFRASKQVLALLPRYIYIYFQPYPGDTVKPISSYLSCSSFGCLLRFPNGTTGQTLDILARCPLWKDGLDYRHGTGHGIGSYLNVHEGPHQISFRPPAQKIPLQPSMTVTDEPGYYEDGNFGIRLENVLIVKEADTKFNFGGKGYLSFEHITWAPYQRKLIDESLLVAEEIEWLNNYNSKCREILAPYLNTTEMEWLKQATEPIGA
ncbi:probable Xaa-Pro aminopeptidase P, partial [Olea europaea var. sylvestris]|uniref:probable Xaa-Pro aminopeptidase P n=1 Tax=Olea europaea var. sylvestris TaxID=158386 RepID=UPI000C1D3660